jgi:DNA-binding PadR family transcriptional regulator
MARENLTLFSYEILGLVGREGAGAHDLLRLARRDRMLAWAGERQYYLEPKRLARLGYLTAHTAPGKTHPRTVYTLTDRGLQALHAWAREPVRCLPFKSEAMVRLLIADLVGEPATRASIATMRDDLADLLARVERLQDGAEQIPHRRKYLQLIAGFMRQLFELHLELIDTVERELAADGVPAPAPTPPLPPHGDVL